ncbi:MAG: NADH-quinone oxidoreductase subunit J [Bacteroidia bacterium]|nr:NADH-quinone oxidoreductase subunit J [Bacteroidia bacterium]
MALQTALFWIFSILGIAGGIGLVINRNPVYSALSLILNFFSLAGLYLSLQAEFLAVIQVLVYAGAIMVLFLFVIMLLNLSDEPRVEGFDIARGASFLLAIGFVAEMLIILKDVVLPSSPEKFTYGKVESIGNLLMTNYLFPFEVISVVLVASLIGAIVIAKKFNY